METISCIEVTPLCNWSCRYCVAGTQRGKHKDFTDEQFEQILKFIKDTDNDIVISGGEPGLIGRNKLFKLFCVLINKNNNIYINTNGTILNIIQYVIDELKDRFTVFEINSFLKRLTIRYHVYESVKDYFAWEDTKKFTFNKLIEHKILIAGKLNIKLEYQIVFTKEDNLEDIRKLINNYKYTIHHIFYNFPLILSPMILSDKNRDSSNISFTKIEVLKLLKHFTGILNEEGIETTEAFFNAFNEALGETRVKYKLHEHTMAWKGIKNVK